MKTPSWKRLAAIGLVAAAVPAVMVWITARACGPDWEPEVFVNEHHPDQPARFAEGHLGILQSGYYHADLVVAYRILSGGKLSDEEKAAYTAGPQSTAGQDRDMGSGPAVDWLKARQVAEGIPTNNQPMSYWFDQNREFRTEKNGSVQVYFELNCTDGAFVTAMETLQQRSAHWGATSPELLEWAHGQDAVFSNCSKAGAMPGPIRPEWPLLLRQDRAYQIAAAKFYSADYDGAIADFEAIGKDKASPWNVWGEYLAARAEVRKAASVVTNPGDSAMGFDKNVLQLAEARLLKIEKDSGDTGMRSAAAAERGFVEVRLNSGKQLDQVAEALAGPKPDPKFAQDLENLDYLMDRGVSGDSDLARWIKEIQFSAPNPTRSATPPSSLSIWRKQHTLPWLVAAMAQPSSKNEAPSELMNAAAAVPPNSPGFEAVNYYRAERMLDAGQQADARTLLTAMLASTGPDTMSSTRNAFLALRMTTARSLSEFLTDSPRTIIDGSSENAELARCDPQPTPATQQPGTAPPCAPQQFDADAAAYLNTQMPLVLLGQAAESSALPAHLRQAIAEMAWVRALALNDTTTLARMAKLLPAPMAQTAGSSGGFPATLALLRAPGVRPFLNQGVQRSDSFAELDHFRDNWWCGRWTDGAIRNQGSPTIDLPPLPFLTAAQRQQQATEAARMNALPQGLVWVGQRAIAYVKAHPTDKDAPETLALVVQATRWGCAEYDSPDAQKALSKEAFEILHHTYPKSEWALKTKYYY
jgi:hypothetical protein